MLVLTRRINEKVRIGDDIEVRVLGVKGNQVRLGINAPQNISVHRAEIYKLIQAQKEYEDEKRLEGCYCSAIPKPPCGVCEP